MVRRIAFFTAFAFLLASAIEVPTLINYQGKLTNAAGQPQTGTFNFVFAIYDAETGGTQYWSETQTVTTDNLGLFNVILGSVNPPVNLPEGPDCYLEITVEGTTLTPRQRIVSNGYSYFAQRAEDAENAYMLGNIPAAQYAVLPIETDEIDDNAVTSAKIQNGTIQMEDLAFTPATAPVGTDEIEDDAVTSAKILNGTIQMVDLAFTPATRPLSPGVSTAEIQDGAVTTAKIAANAVTNIAQFTYGPVYTSYYLYTSWTIPFTYQVSITTTGAPVLILVSTGGWGQYYSTYSLPLDVGLFRDGSLITSQRGDAPYYSYMGAGNIAFSYIDLPSAGTHTYDVRFACPYTSYTFYMNYYTTSPGGGRHFIQAIELKR